MLPWGEAELLTKLLTAAPNPSHTPQPLSPLAPPLALAVSWCGESGAFLAGVGSRSAETPESHLSGSAALEIRCPFSGVPRLPRLTDECGFASSTDGIWVDVPQEKELFVY